MDEKKEPTKLQQKISAWKEGLKDRKKLVLNLLIVFAAAVIVYGVWNMISLQLQYSAAEKEYEGIREEAGMADTDTGEDGDAEEEATPALTTEDLPEVDLETLQAENPDTVGWLYYPVLGINYPIMQDEDNTYYINHTFSGSKNTVGSIFLDALASDDFSDDNTFIFGHNMRNGSMFGNLKNIREEGTVSENPYFWIYLEDGWHRYEIFSYHEADADQSDMAFQISFENKQAFRTFLNYLESISEEELDVEVTDTDKIVTLATCTSNSAVRLVVHGVLST